MSRMRLVGCDAVFVVKKETASEISELLVKLVRVLANLSIHDEVGPLVARSNVVGSLIEILGAHDCSR